MSRPRREDRVRLEGEPPEADPVNHYQYAFVLDADGNTTNNYTPLPQYPADFFKDTDRWYELLYTPTAGWTTKSRRHAVPRSRQHSPTRRCLSSAR